MTHADYDWGMPLRAFMALGGSWWNFQIGRDRLSHGTGQMGNMVISDIPDFYDFIRFSLFSANFKYSLLVNQMQLKITPELSSMSIEEQNLIHTTNRYFYLHRIDINLFDALSIGIMEGVMVGNSPLELRFLSPLMVFHSRSSWDHYDSWLVNENRSMAGSIFSTEVNWSIIPSLSLYGQFVMNEWALNGLGFLAGLQYSHSFNFWALTSFFEFTYTQPYLYMNPSPFASFIHMRYLSDSNRLFYSFIGYPRDMLVFTLGSTLFRADDRLSFSGIFSLLYNGEKDIYYDWEVSEEAFNRRSPTGTVENKFILSLAARWRINPFTTLSGKLTGIHSRNNKLSKFAEQNIPGSNQTGLQSAVSVSFSY
jgi:hypothetical protein